MKSVLNLITKKITFESFGGEGKTEKSRKKILWITYYGQKIDQTVIQHMVYLRLGWLKKILCKEGLHLNDSTYQELLISLLFERN